MNIYSFELPIMKTRGAKVYAETEDEARQLLEDDQYIIRWEEMDKPAPELAALIDTEPFTPENDDEITKHGWEYRVIHESFQGEDWFAIYEVYYKEGDDISTWSYTVNPVKVVGYDLEDMRSSMKMMEACMCKPILHMRKNNQLELYIPGNET
jgi:hypothetical protein